MEYMLDKNMTVQDAEFFKIGEAAWGSKTAKWGTDKLMNDSNMRSMKIPSCIKPGLYVVRHEILALHYAFRENCAEQDFGIILAF
jgi:hypothetical protein